jgi:integrase
MPRELKDRIAQPVNLNKDSIRILSEYEVESLLIAASETRYPIRNRAIILLGVDGGLKPLEMAYLKRRHLLGSDGLLGEKIDLRNKPGSRLSPRVVPMPREGRLWNAMHSLLENVPATPDDPLIISERATEGGQATKYPGTKDLKAMRPSSISYVFYKAMMKAGISDASANTARTTFIVKVVDKVRGENMPIREIQRMSGQRYTARIERIIEGCVEDRKVVIRDMFEE